MPKLNYLFSGERWCNHRLHRILVAMSSLDIIRREIRNDVLQNWWWQIHHQADVQLWEQLFPGNASAVRTILYFRAAYFARIIEITDHRSHPYKLDYRIIKYITKVCNSSFLSIGLCHPLLYLRSSLSGKRESNPARQDPRSFHGRI